MILRLDVTPVYTKNYASEKRIKVNRGGTRSSKTRSIAQLAVLWLFTGQISRNRKIEKGVWSTVRKYSTTLDATVIRDFEEELDKQQLYGAVKHNKTKRTYEYSGRMVEFFGADDEKKLRGAKRDILYCNEANELQFKAQFFQLLIRTTNDVFIDFNPDDENVWINTELEQKRAIEKGDVEVIVSTYKDNTFLPQVLIEEIEYLERTDPEFWKIYGLGQYGKVYGVIFENYTIVNEIPNDAVLVAYGIDFGFTNDPCAIVEVRKQNGELFINELEYKRGMTNNDIAERLKQLGINSYDYIVADSAEPKSIQEIYNHRFNVHGAEKGKDSINNSIDILKRYKLNITSKSVNLLKEVKTYKWATDKAGNSINTPVDYNNHVIDAVRYVALNKLMNNNSGVYGVV
jgi:phage terminase large subunit